MARPIRTKIHLCLILMVFVTCITSTWDDLPVVSNNPVIVQADFDTTLERVLRYSSLDGMTATGESLQFNPLFGPVQNGFLDISHPGLYNRLHSSELRL